MSYITSANVHLSNKFVKVPVSIEQELEELARNKYS